MSARSPIGRRGLVALVSTALVASGAVVATNVASPATASTGNAFANLVTIETTGTSTFARFYPADNTQPVASQALNARNCALPLTGAPAEGPIVDLYATLNGAQSNVGVNAGSIGAAEKANSSGQACSQVNTGTTRESLTVKLDSGRLASTAVLDVEVQKNVVIRATASGPNTTGGRQAQTFYLYTGTSRIPNPPLSDGTSSECNAGATSSAPNSNSSDNCKWQITPTFKFDTLQLAPTADSPGQFSLEGGSDWAGGSTAASGGFPANATYFWLGDVLQCQTAAVTVNGDQTTPTVSIRNVSTSSGPCQGFAFSLTTSGGTATFLKPYSEQSQRLQFMMDLEWQIPNGSVAELPKVFFGFHDRNLVAGTARELPWCADPVFTGQLATGIATNPALNPAMDVETDNTLFPGVQYACMADSKIKRNPTTGQPIAWVQSIYVHGDAYARR